MKRPMKDYRSGNFRFEPSLDSFPDYIWKVRQDTDAGPGAPSADAQEAPPNQRRIEAGTCSTLPGNWEICCYLLAIIRGGSDDGGGGGDVSSGQTSCQSFPHIRLKSAQNLVEEEFV
ncbi:hypothetical protein J6590_016495 [Homalodisca vitripennis]|nr:hypothetical protein J6590_016495 [Homalodisca vitripennis]